MPDIRKASVSSASSCQSASLGYAGQAFSQTEDWLQHAVLSRLSLRKIQNRTTVLPGGWPCIRFAQGTKSSCMTVVYIARLPSHSIDRIEQGKPDQTEVESLDCCWLCGAKLSTTPTNPS
ncbi:MAG: hypothetical protein AAES65_07830 [Candidatus Thiodiazotropha sp. (ex. Lucinoma kazani)]